MSLYTYDHMSENQIIFKNLSKVYKNGFNVTINTDNRLMSDISMSEEVNNVVESFNLNENDISTITKNTIEAAIVDYNLRKKLIEE